jgi:hypothetical protein
LPTPPDAPVSPLAQIKAQLESPTLDLDTQLKLVFQLKQYLGEPDKASGARELLQQLSHHPDVRAAIAQDIAVILGSSPPPAPVMRPPQQQSQRPQSVTVVRNQPPVGVGQSAAVGSAKSLAKPVLVGAAIGLGLAVLSSLEYFSVEAYDAFFGYYTYTDYFSICGLLIVLPVVGAALGWAYTKFVAKPR